MNDLREIERMTMYEYDIRMTAARLKRLDKDRDLHVQSWLNQQVKATKKQGRKEVPFFSNFKRFFDQEKFEQEILGETPQKLDPALNELLKRANSRGKEENDE